MSPRQKQRGRARRRVETVLSGGPVEGVMLDVRRGHVVEWAEPLNAGWYGIPDGNPKWVVKPATVDVDDWLELQRATLGGGLGMDRFLGAARDRTIERAAESVRSGRNDIPTPVLEIRHDGSVVQEGRSRALGARHAGARLMPVWVAAQVYR